ncbi:hypothetical protein ES288_D02G104000v1 [Gossypium darwinii]|uniref:Uncharacterized protein n=1 Tax=Gossypium darwinii TaxID=34276 RepID=A0A5D2DAY9_GOSDA|nr:hypothetical protein ES288_D02G104000v1 [Gossypium darwinii]
MSVNSRNAKEKDIESNTPLQSNSLGPTANWGALGAEARKALMKMMGHVMGQWFEKYMDAAPSSSHQRRDETVRPEETTRTAKATQPINLSPHVSAVIMSRWDPMEAIHNRGIKKFKGSKEDDPVVVEN